jgi:hypothetical protein
MNTASATTTPRAEEQASWVPMMAVDLDNINFVSNDQLRTRQEERCATPYVDAHRPARNAALEAQNTGSAGTLAVRHTEATSSPFFSS